MPSETQRQLVKATTPVLNLHGVTLSSHFYSRMFTHNPELREFFNQGHQRSGGQQQALAMAITAYADHIDDPSVLLPTLERIAAKHVSLGIRKEHYAIVGKHLLASIREVLGAAATDELVEAWAVAYSELAELLSDMEQKLYDNLVASNGGWTGWRTFRVKRKTRESEEVTSFEIVPADGGMVPVYLPGQYISVRVVVDSLGYRQPRQYSLSDAPGKGCFRISVKREVESIDRPAGMVSNHLHAHVNEGDLIEVAPPAGDFYLNEMTRTPVVLISGGVGITPMMSMLERLALTSPNRPLRFLHASRDASVQAFGQRIDELISQMDDAQSWIVHEAIHDTMPHQPHAIGRLELTSLTGHDMLPKNADYYICGPSGFMTAQIQALRTNGIPECQIHAEAFGTGGVAS